MPLEEYQICYEVRNQRMKAYIVDSIVRQGKRPRYELRGRHENRLELLMFEEKTWMNKTIFVDIGEAESALKQEIEDRVAKWASEMFRGKERLVQYLYDLWIGVDNYSTLETDMTFQDPRQRKKKAELMVRYFKDYFNVGVTIPHEVLTAAENRENRAFD